MLGRWKLVEADLHEVYGIDLGDPELKSRSWRWMRVRILALFERPPAVAPDGTVVPSTRIGLALMPPKQPRG